MHVCTNGQTPKSYNHVWSGHDGKGCVFVCGLCSGMYCDTYVFMYMNMQNMFELSLQAPRKFIAAVGEKCFWLLRLISVRERQARGLSNAGLPPVGLDCKGWLTFALRFIRSICELTFEIIDELCISYNSLVRTRSKPIHDHWRKSSVWRECGAQPVSVQAKGSCMAKW